MTRIAKASRSPIRACFNVLLSVQALEAHSTVHVGDLFHVDVVGARAAGIRAVLLDAANLYGAHDCERVGSLTEFVDQLEADRLINTTWGANYVRPL